MIRFFLACLILGLVFVACGPQIPATLPEETNALPSGEAMLPSPLQSNATVTTTSISQKWTPTQTALAPRPSPTLRPPATKSVASPTPSQSKATVTSTSTPEKQTPTQVVLTPQPSRTPHPSATKKIKSPTPSPTSTEIASPAYPIAGIQTSNLASQTRINQIQDAGAYWTHFTVLEWDQIEPQKETPVNYNWAAAQESGMRLAKEAGLNLIAVVQFTPDWAQQIPGVACGPIAENALERFAFFMYEAVRRYSQPPYEVKYWEIGNEMDVLPSQVDKHSGFGCWGVQDDPYYGGEYYAEMLKAVYPQIKAADPDAQVLVGGLLLDCDPDNPPANKDCSPSRFIDGILKNKGADYFDGIGFHAYDYYQFSLGVYSNANWSATSEGSGPVLKLKANYLKSQLAQYGYSNKYLMLTEVALICGSTGNETPCTTQDAQQTKAIYAAQAMVSARALGIRSAIWYSLEGWRASGLITGSACGQSVYQSFQFAAAFLADASFVNKIEQYPGAFIYEFQKSGKRYWIAWTGNPDGQTITLTDIPTTIYNIFGEILSVNDTLDLTSSPIYIEWNE